MNEYSILNQTQLKRISDGKIIPILTGCSSATRLLILILPQLGDFDSMEYAWWLTREWDNLQKQHITIRVVGIGNQAAGEKFCDYIGLPKEFLFIDPNAEIHQKLNLYQGLSLKFPLLSPGQNAFLNLMLMCAGVASPGTLTEVFRGYLGDKQAPQLITNDEVIHAKPLPPFKGSFFNLAGGKGFQRPFELATLRLKNMTEVLSNWSVYVSNPAFLTQRGGTFLFDQTGNLLYQYRDRSLLGFAENMSNPLSFLQ